MTARSSSKDRTPARRAVPTLIAVGLLLWITWLLVAIGRLDHQLHPLPARPAGPMTITIPSLGVKAGIVGPEPPARRSSSGMWTTTPARPCSTGCGSFAPATKFS